MVSVFFLASSICAHKFGKSTVRKRKGGLRAVGSGGITPLMLLGSPKRPGCQCAGRRDELLWLECCQSRKEGLYRSGKVSWGVYESQKGRVRPGKDGEMGNEWGRWWRRQQVGHVL